MNHDAVKALLLSVACFEYQFDRPPTTREIVEMRGKPARALIHLLRDQGLLMALVVGGRGTAVKVGWSALQAQGLRKY